jgi:hypothetical protein
MTDGSRYGAAAKVLPVLFAVTLFTSAALLFVVELLVARLVLPLLGGTPAVWNTCMVFFQALLLAGYAYAQAISTRLGRRGQAASYLAIIALAWLVLPVLLTPSWSSPATAFPFLWLVGLLLWCAGLPFFALAASTPLLQRWFASTGHPSGRDPYFLYAASNLGSLLGLLSYPLLLEPKLSLAQQGRAWAAGYAIFLTLAAVCALAFIRSAGTVPASLLPVSPPIAWRRRLRWMLWGFVPSSLMLSVTTYLTTDVAAVPLLWVLPLAVYLVTFILAFARQQRLTPDILGRWLPLVALVVVLALVTEATEPAGVLGILHLAGLYWVALYCHASVAADRPPADRLVEFYLILAIGGVLGGLFNALLAPLLFSRVVEYPLVLVLACALRPAVGKLGLDSSRRQRLLDLALPLALGLVAVAAVLGVQAWGLRNRMLSMGLMFVLPAAVCYSFLARPVRFALGLAALVIAGSLYGGIHGTTQYRARNFFGVHRVTLDPTHSYRMLVHGNTVHGMQSLDPARRHEPLNYYSVRSPIGKVFDMMNHTGRLHRVGVVGLGTGALCCYAKQGQHWTFYEIDPAVVSIACDSGLFTFWSDCAVKPALVVGDARIQLARADEEYDLLVIDAFSSDAIPMHLLTREALAIYRAHLAPGGVLAFNISNRYLELAGVLGNLAADACPPLVCWSRDDNWIVERERKAGRSPSHWVVLADCAETLAPLRQVALWEPAPVTPARRVWSDDYSNLFQVFHWEPSGGD